MNKARDTRRELRNAILRIEHGRPRRIAKDRCQLNISMVAREAGVTPACIHNSYPDIADVIRKKMRKTDRSAKDAQRVEVQRLTESLRSLRKRLSAAERDLVCIASENARLLSENEVLRAKAAASNVVVLPDLTHVM